MAGARRSRVDYVFGLARNKRLEAMIPELARPRRRLPQRTRPRAASRTSPTAPATAGRERRVVGKAEHLEKGANPRFVVTSLAQRAHRRRRQLYEKVYCARGEMENRIKECQLDLFADRTSTATMRANQLRLWLASLAYVLMQAVRAARVSRARSWPSATAGSIRLKLLKIGAVVTLSLRRIKLASARRASPVLP